MPFLNLPGVDLPDSIVFRTPGASGVVKVQPPSLEGDQASIERGAGRAKRGVAQARPPREGEEGAAGDSVQQRCGYFRTQGCAILISTKPFVIIPTGRS